MREWRIENGSIWSNLHCSLQRYTTHHLVITAHPEFTKVSGKITWALGYLKFLLSFYTSLH